jgi:hypothetical protein
MTASVFYESASELATLTNTFSVSGTATDPTTVSLTITTPSGTATTYTYALGQITKTATGVYTKDVACSEDGLWIYVWTGTGTASDVVAGTWQVFTTSLQTIYASLEELKDARRISDTVDDAALLTRLERASRAIDVRCRGEGGHFYPDASATARQYRTRSRVTRDRDGELLLVDDISSTTGLIVEVGDGTTWTAVTDYFEEPENAVARGHAITALRRNYGYWCTTSRVRVTALWGWPAVPANVREATWLLANRRFMRRDSPEGVAGWSDQGPIRVSRFDSDIEDLLQPYVLDGLA